MKRTHIVGVSAIVLAGTLGLATVANAAGDDGQGGRRGRQLPQLTDEQKCEHQDRIRQRAELAQERLAMRIERLEDRRAEAEAAGNAELVARIDRVIERMEQWQERITERLAGFESWVIEHCDETAPTAG